MIVKNWGKYSHTNHEYLCNLLDITGPCTLSGSSVKKWKCPHRISSGTWMCIFKMCHCGMSTF